MAEEAYGEAREEMASWEACGQERRNGRTERDRIEAEKWQ